MADYGDMFYGTLPQDTQDFRQVLAGIGRTIRDRAIAAGQRIGQSGQEAIALQNQIFGDPNRPLRVTDENALRRFTDMIMGGPLGFAPAGITAYHGSPYLFRMFNPAKVGTGEGAQAYGVGAGYTAEARPVAEQYMRQVTAGTPQPPVRTFKGQELTPQTPEYMAARLLDADKMSLPQARKEVASWISSAGPEMSQEVAKWQRTLEILNQAEKKSDFKNLGERSYLYKGDIPDEILPKFLDWDRPIKEQSEEVQKLAKQYKLNPDDLGGDLVGAVGKTAQGSQIMEAAGIRGIKYLDANSRNAKYGSQNFIPFRSEDYKIQEINDIPIEEWARKGLLD